jgi:hypothetical protein
VTGRSSVDLEGPDRERGQEHSPSGGTDRNRMCRPRERCCLNTPARRSTRSMCEHAREVVCSLRDTTVFERSRQGRKRIEMLLPISSRS